MILHSSFSYLDSNGINSIERISSSISSTYNTSLYFIIPHCRFNVNAFAKSLCPTLTAAEGVLLDVGAKIFSCCGVPTKKGLTKSVKPFACYAQVNVPRIAKQLSNKSPTMTVQMMLVTIYLTRLGESFCVSQLTAVLIQEKTTDTGPTNKAKA